MARLLLPLALALALLAGRASATTHASTTPSQGVTLAIDANASGNAARTIAAIDACVSASVGRPINVDIVLPPPGIPATLGLSGFEFTLFFDSRVLSLTADNSRMLLAQALGSRVFPFTSELPNTSGEYQSVAADFGAQGIEPAGSSETGPGVLARLTLTPKAEGVSDLVLRQVSLADDASHKIPVESGQQARVVVGAPCAAASPSPPPAPASPAGDGNSVAPAPATAAATSPQSTTAPGSGPAGPASFGSVGGSPSPETAGEQHGDSAVRARRLPGDSSGATEAGQPIAEDGNNWTWPLLAGVLLSATGGALIAGVVRRHSHRRRE